MRKWRSQAACSLSLISSESQRYLPGNQVDLSTKCEYCKGGKLHSSLFFSCTSVHIEYPTHIYWLHTTSHCMWLGMQWWARHMPFLPLQGNTDSRKLVYRLLARVRWTAFRPRVKNRLLFRYGAPFILLAANRVHLVQNSFSHYKTCGQRRWVFLPEANKKLSMGKNLYDSSLERSAMQIRWANPWRALGWWSSGAVSLQGSAE